MNKLLGTKYDSVRHALNLLEEKFCYDCEYWSEFRSSTSDLRFRCEYKNELIDEDPEKMSCDHWKKDLTGRGRPWKMT